MLFDQTAPTSAMWTPPKQATGFNKGILALMGYNPNGTQNGFGKVTSLIPGFGVAANNSAQVTARNAGLGDVASTIGEDMDNRLQKLQAGVGVVKGAVGVATANPELIQSGIQGVTQSVGGLMQANQPIKPYQGSTAYQRFVDGGKLSVKPVGRLPEKAQGEKSYDQAVMAGQKKAEMDLISLGIRSLPGMAGDEGATTEYVPVNMARPVAPPSMNTATGELSVPSAHPLATRSNIRSFIRADNETASVAEGQPLSSVTSVIAPGRSVTTNNKRDAANAGVEYTRNWFNQQAALRNAGLTNEAMGIAPGVSNVKLQTSQEIGRVAPGAQGYYNPGTGRSYVSVENSPGYISTASAHESTHQAQDILQAIGGSSSPEGALKDTYEAIQSRLLPQHKRLFGSKAATEYENYIRQPDEVHARIMELRKELNMRPIDGNADRSKFDEYMKSPNQAGLDLKQVLPIDAIYELLDPKKTVMNNRPSSAGVLYAATGGKLPGGSMYKSSDKTSEDAVIIDKATGVKLGEMRHNERIFDQQATKTMEKLADKNDHVSLGKFVLTEMATHPDRKGAAVLAFADGGKLSVKPIGRLPERNKAQRFADQSALNRRADEAMWQVANGYAPVDSLTGIMPGESSLAPAIIPLPLSSITMGDGVVPEVTVSGKRTASPTRPLSMLPEGSAPSASLMGMTGKVVTPVAIKSNLMPTTAPTMNNPSTKKSSSSTDWLGIGSDVVRGLTAAYGAAQPLPTRPVNPNLMRVERDLADRANEGLSANERVNLMRQQADAQARDVQAIRDTVGGGGSAAAVLSALGSSGKRASEIGQQIEGIDRSQRAQNQQNYVNDLRASQQGSDNIFSQQYALASQNKAAYAQAAAANIQNIADRQQYDKSYGKGSPYYNLMLQLAKKTGENQAYADAPVTNLFPKMP